ncbi:hypothetical protein KP509_17G001100 [Ceratopteris richardii]|uniref:Pentatricopeptide repeat-containing protein n=1 Tax=Ceratopteris richardii TaxID=49495 RepID=A0A8T2ST43_CERRI|nr:hypothetical protein KP509_17G001100 [Ceratopteris richardii]
MSNALMDMYVKCGSILKAEEVFDCITSRDLISWNTQISGFMLSGDNGRVFSLFDRMRREGQQPDNVTFVSGLKACGKICATKKGTKLHAEIARRGSFESDVHMSNALMDMYVKCGSILKAEEVFDCITSHDLISWNTLISGFMLSGDNGRVFSLFDRMRRDGILPDNVTFVSGLKACGKICATKKGTKLHAEIARRGSFESDVLMSNALMDMYVKCGSILKAEEVFDCITSHDLISWNTLISGFMLSGDNGRVFSLFDRMRREGQQPDSATFASGLKACGKICATKKGTKLHAEIARRGSFESDVLMSNALMDMYVKCGSILKAEEVFDCITSHDLISWNTLISGFMLSGDNGRVFSLFDRMRREGQQPDSATFASGLKACGKICATKKGTKLHAEIARRGSFESDVLMSNALMDMYVKCGSILKAEEVFDCITSHDLISWNTLISGFMLSGDNGRVFSLFDRMRREGQQPDSATFASILRCCSQAVQMERCELLLESMGKYFGISPSLKHYTCVIGLLARCGCLHQAIKSFNSTLRKGNITHHEYIQVRVE